MRFTITLAAETDDGLTHDIPIALIERADDTLTIDDLFHDQGEQSPARSTATRDGPHPGPRLV